MSPSTSSRALGLVVPIPTLPPVVKIFAIVASVVLKLTVVNPIKFKFDVLTVPTFILVAYKFVK